MSYCQIITFKDGLPHEAMEFRNAWGGAARIWTSLFDRYVKNPEIPYDNWLGDKSDRLWSLAHRSDIPDFERAVLAATFDLHFIRHENFAHYASDLRAFVDRHPSKQGNVCHLQAWAESIEKMDAEAIGFYATSVGENLWYRYDETEDESAPVPLSKGCESYDWLDSLRQTPTTP